jgi:hypothetical protein
MAEDGYLKLKANISDVRVTIANKTQSVGIDWSFIQLPPGRYSLEATKEYYQTQKKTITISSGRVMTLALEFTKPSGFIVEKPQDMTIVKGYGDLTIVTDIPGATVRLNGQSVSGEVAPMTVKQLPEGEWTIEVTLNEKTLSERLLIKANELSTARFFFDNEKKAAFLEQQEMLRRQKEQKTQRQEEQNALTARKAFLETRLAQAKRNHADSNSLQEKCIGPSLCDLSKDRNMPSSVRFLRTEKFSLGSDVVTIKIYGGGYYDRKTKTGFASFDHDLESKTDAKYEVLVNGTKQLDIRRWSTHSIQGKDGMFSDKSRRTREGSSPFSEDIHLQSSILHIRSGEKQTSIDVSATPLESETVHQMEAELQSIIAQLERLK